MEAEISDQDNRISLWRGLYLFGSIGFVLSALGFVLTLVLNSDIRLPVAVNGVSAVLIISCVAADRIGDPRSGVSSVPGAVGTAMLFLAIYGVLAAIGVALTSLWHGQIALIWYLLGAAAIAIGLGIITFPFELILGDVRGDDDH